MGLSEIARPEDLVTLQWVIITVLIGVIGYLWRELRRCDGRSKEMLIEFLTRVLTGLSDSNEVIANLAGALEDYQEQLDIQKQLELLRGQLAKHDSKD